MNPVENALAQFITNYGLAFLAGIGATPLIVLLLRKRSIVGNILSFVIGGNGRSGRGPEPDDVDLESGQPTGAERRRQSDQILMQFLEAYKESTVAQSKTAEAINNLSRSMETMAHSINTGLRDVHERIDGLILHQGKRG